MIVSKYPYIKLEREESATSGRKYILPNNEKVVSVTTILDATKSIEKIQSLEEWKNRVGDKNAKQIKTEAANVGTLMHKKLEEYVLGVRKPAGSNIIHQQADKMAQVIINKGLCRLNECWGSEVNLHYDDLYAGTTDLVGVFDNTPAILDFKQTNKPKKTEYIDDYFIQLVAYIECHNKTYNTDIKTGVILMCSRNFEYQEWILTGAEFEKYQLMWWKKVKQYYELIC